MLCVESLPLLVSKIKSKKKKKLKEHVMLFSSAISTVRKFHCQVPKPLRCSAYIVNDVHAIIVLIDGSQTA